MRADSTNTVLIHRFLSMDTKWAIWKLSNKSQHQHIEECAKYLLNIEKMYHSF